MRKSTEGLAWFARLGMNRVQGIALAVAGANLLLMLLFPPYDYLSIDRGNVPTFGGFFFLFARHDGQRLNTDFLILELIVVLLNAAIAYLLLRPRQQASSSFGVNRHQRMLLFAISMNLLAMLLFPPFENFNAITNAALPSFEGFYFLFGDNVQRQIVMPLLYLELALALINGGLLWLVLKERKARTLSAAEMHVLVRNLRSMQKP